MRKKVAWLVWKKNQTVSSLEFSWVIDKGTSKEATSHCTLFRLSKVYHEATKKVSLHGIWITFFSWKKKIQQTKPGFPFGLSLDYKAKGIESILSTQHKSMKHSGHLINICWMTFNYHNSLRFLWLLLSLFYFKIYLFHWF